MIEQEKCGNNPIGWCALAGIICGRCINYFIRVHGSKPCPGLGCTAPGCPYNKPKPISKETLDAVRRCVEIAHSEAAEWGERENSEDGFTAAVNISAMIEREFGLDFQQSISQTKGNSPIEASPPAEMLNP